MVPRTSTDVRPALAEQGFEFSSLCSHPLGVRVTIDYLLRVVVENLEDFERIHRESITRLPGISRVQTSFALRTVAKGRSLPIR